MMNVPALFESALASDQIAYAWLLKLGDTHRLTNHSDDIVIGADTYLSDGRILRFPSIVRERQIKLQSYSVEFSNVDRSASTLFSDPEYKWIGAPCEVLLALLDSSGGVVSGAAVSLYRGAFDSWVERGTASTATVTVKITSPWATPNLTAGRITSDYAQKDRFPGDRFFEFAHENKNTIAWGSAEDNN